MSVKNALTFAHGDPVPGSPVFLMPADNVIDRANRTFTVRWPWIGRSMRRGALSVGRSWRQPSRCAGGGHTGGVVVSGERSRSEGREERLHAVLASIGALLKTVSSSHADLERKLAFFKRNHHRMGYHELQSRVLIVGSGTVEAANKVPVTQRMTWSGMQWTVDGGQGILSTRALLKSGRFNAA